MDSVKARWIKWLTENQFRPHTRTTSYEDWRFDLQLWNDWTKVDKARRGFLVFRCLPEEKGVNEKVRFTIQTKDIKLDSEDAVAKILTVLDKWFKDDLSVICETWSAFINMRKKRSDNMDEYIGLFERKVGELKKEGTVLPDVVLAMQLLDSSAIEQKDKQIVLTDVDYSKSDEMYAQMQSSLRKFFGEQVIPCKGVRSGLQIGIGDVQIKEESANVAYNDQRSYSRGRRNFSGRASFSRNYGNNRWMAASGGRGRGINQNRMNPVDSQGKLMKCLPCESIMHFKRDCPHASKNKKDSVLQATDIEEDVNKVYDYSQENKQQLIQEAANMAILDSACTKTVTGCIWRDIYLESLSKEERNKIKHYPGGTNFKFGGETKIRSIEKLEIPCNVAGKKNNNFSGCRRQ